MTLYRQYTRALTFENICQEAKRGKVEAELQLSHAVEKIEELSEWKAMNSSRAIWEAVEARDHQAREEEEELKQALQALLQTGETNLQHLTQEAQGICRALGTADAPVALPCEIDIEGWGVLAERSPELASLGQTLAAGQAQLLTQLVAVRAALEASDQQAHQEVEELKLAVHALLQTGETNLRHLTQETQGICRALFAADAPVALPGEVEVEGWEVLADRSPELASLGQTLAAGQAQLLTQLVAVRAALDGGGSSRCPSCQASEMETATHDRASAGGAPDTMSERERLGERGKRGERDMPSRQSFGSLSPIQLPTNLSEYARADGAETRGQVPSTVDAVEVYI